jgi:serine/threonine protein kinase
MGEVTEGLRYIHSEGIVHGDLCGVRILISGLSTSTSMYQENILLDSTFRCQISGFGLTRNSAATTSSMLNFIAPELFIRSDQLDLDTCYEHYNMRERKTMQTDVYAFGCLYYAVGLFIRCDSH